MGEEVSCYAASTSQSNKGVRILKKKRFLTPPMKPDVSMVFSIFFSILFSLYVPFTMLDYDRSSHAPIQGAVNIFIFAHSPIKLIRQSAYS